MAKQKTTLLRKALVFLLVFPMIFQSLLIGGAISAAGDADISIDSITITNGFSASYGEAAWKDYTIEFDMVGMANAGAAMKVQFRETPGNNMYRFVIEPGGRANIDGVVKGSGWGSYLTNYSGPNAFTQNVHYKLEVTGANIKVFVNGSEVINFTDSNASRVSALAAGKITLASDGVTGTIENFEITCLDNSGTEPGVVYQNAGPNPLPISFGDSTWEDYEFEFDITPISGSNFRVEVRGGAYYTFMSGQGNCWVGIQPQSGQGGL